MPDKCLVLLSGGQDSTTTALLACQIFNEVHALTINYGQRHEIEIQSARAIASALNLASHETLDLGGDVLHSTSPLIADTPVERYDRAEDMPDGVASSFIPARNALMLTIAANRAIEIEAKHIWTGVCSTDYSGYPDCRKPFIDAMQVALSQALFGLSGALKIHAPLMNMTKAETVMVAKTLLDDRDFDRVFSLTQTCYNGVKGGCGHCAACLLRDRGFKKAGVADPIWKFREVAA